MNETALHERIRADIEGQILSGAVLPGGKIPSELELMEVYGCSRATVNKALSRLNHAGLVHRRRKVGTVVAKPTNQSMVLDVPDLRTEIAKRGQTYRYDVIDRVIRSAARNNEEEKRLAGKGRLFFVKGVHIADNRPFAFEERLISLATVPTIVKADFTFEPPGSWLLEHIAWTEAENIIGATAASEECAACLAIPVDSSCLLVERRTWRGEEGITQVRQQFAAGSYNLIARFGPDQGKKP